MSVTEDRITDMPYTNAKTMYGLLNAVARIVLEEPRRLDMCYWKQTRDRDGRIPNRGWPSCGTVCCIGGWMETLVPGLVIDSYDREDNILGYEIMKELCYPADLIRAEQPQTLGHAKKTVAHIRAFQRKYKALLKSIQLPVATR